MATWNNRYVTFFVSPDGTWSDSPLKAHRDAVAHIIDLQTGIVK